MRKYLAYYENEWPANIAELTAIENKPFVGYLKGEGVLFTVIPEPVPNNELWYTSTNGTIINFPSRAFDVSIVSNEYNDGKGVLTFDGPITSIDYEGLAHNSLLTSVTLPNSVTRLVSRAFWYCTSLTSVTIPNSVTSIGEEAFAYCSSLTSITIPKSVTSIGKSAFNSCKYLTSVTISEGVTSIGNYAFSNCIRLTAITIPNSVTSIGTEAFSWCSKLASVTFEGTMEEWNMVNKKSGWKANTSVTYVQCTDGQVTL